MGVGVTVHMVCERVFFVPVRDLGLPRSLAGLQLWVYIF